MGSHAVASSSSLSSPWLFTPAWDAFWFHGGLWLPVLVVWLPDSLWSPLYLFLVLTLWLAHRFASAWVFWTTDEFQAVRKAHGPVLLLKTLGLFGGIGAWLLLPGLGVSTLERLAVLLLIDFGLILHHFAAQHFGMLRLYAAAESPPPPRKQDWHFCLWISVVAVPLAELLQGASLLQDPELPLPVFLVPETLTPLLKGLGAAAIGGLVLRALRQEPRGKSPRQAYLLGLGVLGGCGFLLPPEQFLAVWTLQHWMVSVGLKSALSSTPEAGKAHRWRTVLLLVLLTGPLVPFLEFDGLPGAPRATADWVPWLEALVQEHTWWMVLATCGFASGWAHYLHDRATFRLSDPLTRSSVQRLFQKEQQCR